MSIYPATGGNFTTTGTWGSDGSTPVNRYNNDAGGVSVGTYTVTGLASGRYLVGVEYQLSSNRSTQTTHVLKDGSTTLATIPVNQQQNSTTGLSDGGAVASGAGINDGTYTYASLGFHDVTSGTFTLAISTPDGGGGGGNYAVAGALVLIPVAPGYNGPLAAGHAVSGTSTILYLPGTTDPLSHTVFAYELGGQAPAEVISTAADSLSGNVQLAATFWGSSLGATRQQYLGARADSTVFHNGYYAFLELDSGSVALRVFDSGSATQIASLYVDTTFAANHLYTFTLNIASATKTLLELFVQDQNNADQYLTDLGVWSAIPQPCVTLIDDPQTTSESPIAGAGHTVIATYNQPILGETYTVSAVPMPGVTPYLSVYPIRYRFDTSGNPLQIRNPGFWFEPSLGLYLMVGVDASSGSKVAGGEDYPNPGGIVLYTSPDFLNWTYIRKITTTTIGGFTFDWTLFPRIRRHPNGTYFLWIECGMGDLSGIAVSLLTTTGDPRSASWTTVFNNWTPGGLFTPNGFNFLLDGGNTYMVTNGGQSGTNAIFNYAPLKSDWTDLATAWSTLSITGLSPDINGNYDLESTTLFKHGSNYYACGSYGTGWSPNPNQFAKSSTLAGPYAACPYAFSSSAVTGAADSYNTQINDVFTLPDGTPVLSSDRWLKADFNACSHLLAPLAFDGSANPTVPWAAWVPAAPPTPTFVAAWAQIQHTIGVGIY